MGPLKSHFRRFLDAAPGRLHFAAHSHHPWPDVSFDAHQQAWLDAARLADDKWEHVFGEVWPEAQRHVAAELALPSPEAVVFATSTHELVARLLSCLPERPRIVTTDGEFHSFDRQSRRLEELGLAQVDRVAVEPLATFGERLVDAAQRGRPDLVFFSHVFFSSGAVVPRLDALVRALPAGPLVVIDGYHAFCGVPVELGGVAPRAVYLAGGYKYAMAGEGACFAAVPPTLELRPRNTGWFAAFGALEHRAAGVAWAAGAKALLGATFDPSGLYRLNAVMRWRRSVGLTTAVARAHAHALQQRLVSALGQAAALPVQPGQLVVPDGALRGQFLAFSTPRAAALAKALHDQGVITDARDDRLRLGFGVYQDEADVDALVRALERIRA